jgi:hypothetical protein
MGGHTNAVIQPEATVSVYQIENKLGKAFMVS